MSIDPAGAPIAVVVAMRTELRHIFPGMALDAPVAGSRDPVTAATRDDPNWAFAELPVPTRPPLAGTWPVWTGLVEQHPVIAVLSGIGPANAAGALGALLATTPVRAVISFGCAGAHRRDLRPGDVIIGASSINHSAVNLLPGGDEQYRGNTATTGPDPMPPSETASDPALLAAAHRAAEGWRPAPWPAGGRVPNVLTGNIASADVWTQHMERLDRISERHGTLAEEMEAAALGVICQRLGIPFLPIKDISNNEFQQVSDVAGGLDEFPFAEVGRRAAALTLRTIADLNGIHENQHSD